MLRPLNPREVTPVPIKWKAGWAPEWVWAFGENKSFVPAWSRTPQHPARILVTLGLQNDRELVYVRFSKFKS